MKTDLTALIVGLLASIAALVILSSAFFNINLRIFAEAGPFILIGVAIFALFVAIRGNNN